ncbi:hypothetical protein TBLA_0F01150 [Henningerozyma blattae CBS 6284]|uniref:Uncharacterized protein n=1 Tax=Henningerozyma blattae (strain ATCC 34711 / CBS 6284 / DSM 70876 / NBRC 10599 / NRRL Y-10934 / UCD 77-7) TaxID=1071380 RepID=I2H5K6_HENB6|nr:hypothetical protein TBLA_0F01150 [Tetrapisispora blattae CBS 6284]CCH61658.1 hypothetical protein TBLA_0F01150 [Tetrapisispora blattae CBS 6284]
MPKKPCLSLTYGILPSSHQYTDKQILPINKLASVEDSNGISNFISCSRDGSVIIREYTTVNVDINSCKLTKLNGHTDWINDLVILDHNRFITVGNDCLIILYFCMDNIWSFIRVGTHSDYIKCIDLLPCTMENCYQIVTCGLDGIIKLWQLNFNLYNGGLQNIQLLNTWTNTKDNISIYSLQTVKHNFNDNFDFIIGDSTGDIVFFKSDANSEVLRIKNKWISNIKVLKLLNNDTYLFSSFANGKICLYDLELLNNVQLLNNTQIIDPSVVVTYNWNYPIWSIYGDSLEELYLGDMMGNINRFAFQSTLKKFKLKPLYNNTKNNGILSLTKTNNNNNLWFSISNSSDLLCLDLLSLKTTKIIEGGFALKKCSLLCDRIHVLTMDTLGNFQKWNIITCTVKNDKATNVNIPANNLIVDFDQAVKDCNKSTNSKSLPKWCEVTIKVGVLFVKINENYPNYYIPSKLLQKFSITNNFQIEDEKFYNIKKIFLFSLLQNFIKYESQRQTNPTINSTDYKENTNKVKEATYEFANQQTLTFSNGLKETTTLSSSFSSDATVTDEDSNLYHTHSYSLNLQPTRDLSSPSSSVYRSDISILSKELLKQGLKDGLRDINEQETVQQLEQENTNHNHQDQYPIQEGLIPQIVGQGQLQENVLPQGQIQGQEHNSILPTISVQGQDVIPPQTLGNTPLSISSHPLGQENAQGNIFSQIMEQDRVQIQENTTSLSSQGMGKLQKRENICSEQNQIKENLAPYQLRHFPQQDNPSPQVQKQSQIQEKISSQPLHQASTYDKMVSRAVEQELIQNQPQLINGKNLFFVDYITKLYDQRLNDSTKSASPESSLSHETANDQLDYPLLNTPLFKFDNQVPLIQIDSNIQLTVEYIESAIPVNQTIFKTILPKQVKENYQLYRNLERFLPFWLSKILFIDDTIKNKDPLLVPKKKITNSSYKKKNQQDHQLKFTVLPCKKSYVSVSRTPAAIEINAASTSSSSNSKDDSHNNSSSSGISSSSSSNNNNPGSIFKSFMKSSNNTMSKFTQGTQLPKINLKKSKLISNESIQVRAIKTYISNLLNKKLLEINENLSPTQWIELTCKDKILEDHLTLGYIQSHYWKSNDCIIIHYRRKLIV